MEKQAESGLQDKGGRPDGAQGKGGSKEKTGAAHRKAARVRERQAQILKAARACFRAEGFHGASMSRIAAAAGMSVGHIYQYYKSKEAIIIAISESDFAEFIARMPDPGAPELRRPPSGGKAPPDNIDWLLDPDHAAMAVEVMSEASRNPAIGALVQRVGSDMRRRIIGRLEERIERLPAAEAQVRIEALMLMMTGLGVRATIDPAVDHRKMRQAVAVAVAALLPAAPAVGENGHG